MKPDFDRAARRPPPDIATRHEVRQRLAALARATPRPVAQLAPRGPIRAAVDRGVGMTPRERLDHMKRLDHIAGRFQDARERLARGFATIGHQPAQRAEFEQAR